MHFGHIIHDRRIVVFCLVAIKALLQAASTTLCGTDLNHVSIGNLTPFRPLLYAVSSTISLFSLQLAEMIDLMRDLYEVRHECNALTDRHLLSTVFSAC